MKSFNIIRYLKKWWPLIALMSFCAGVFFMRDATQQSVLYGAVHHQIQLLSGRGRQDPRAASELDVSEIFSSSVVKEAIENLDLTVNVDTIRSSGGTDHRHRAR